MDNITTISLVDFFSGSSLAGFFIKAFSVVFGLLFFVYAAVTYKQTQEICRTVQNSRNKFIIFISLLQVVMGIVLLVFAILFV